MAKEEARMTKEIAKQLQDQFQNHLEHIVQQQLVIMMERQRADTSTGTSQVHPHYDEAHDDQPLP